MKSTEAGSFYVSEGSSDDDSGRFSALPTTGSPWGQSSQHGGPPAALLTRAIEQFGGRSDRAIGRFTMDLYGPVPVGHLSVFDGLLRPGRTVELIGSVLYDDSAADGGKSLPVARAHAWCFPAHDDGPGRSADPLGHSFRDGEHHDRPESWASGYLDSVEWRWIEGAVGQPGPGVVWMRPSVDLVAGEPMTPMQRLMVCADSASGISAELDPAQWRFLNTELTVHVLRPPLGEWVCVSAQTTLGPGSVGVATSDVHDERGLVARSAQALLVARR